MVLPSFYVGLYHSEAEPLMWGEGIIGTEMYKYESGAKP